MAFAVRSDLTKFLMSNKPDAADPGTKYIYSPTNYAIAAHMAEVSARQYLLHCSFLWILAADYS